MVVAVAADQIAEFARSADRLTERLRKDYHNGFAQVVVRPEGLAFQATAWEEFGWVKFDAEELLSWMDICGPCVNLPGFSSRKLESEIRTKAREHQERAQDWQKAIVGGK